MAGAGAKGFAKREHEPITLVCLVVFMLASVIVIGTWVSDQITGESSETVQYGDSVTVEYTGSLYGFYDQGTDTMVPVIFDTNVKSIGTNTNYVFTSTFNGTYSTTTLTLGQGKFLAGFENGLMGKKVGETVRIAIPGDEAYPAVMGNTAKSSFTFDNSLHMTKSELSDYFENVGDITGMATLTSKLCDNLTADVIWNGNDYSVQYKFATATDYVVLENSLGKVILNVTDISGTTVTYTLTVDHTIPVNDDNGDPVQIESHNAIEMLSLKLFRGVSYNIVAVSGTDPTDLVVNTFTDGKALIGGYELYFVVKIVSKN